MGDKKLKHTKVSQDERGEYEVDLPSDDLHMNICEMNKDNKSEHHRHTYEAIIYIVEGSGYTMIAGEKIEWKKGDAVYVPPWEWHQHIALSDCKIVSCTNENLFKKLNQKNILEIKEKAS